MTTESLRTVRDHLSEFVAPSVSTNASCSSVTVSPPPCSSGTRIWRRWRRRWRSSAIRMPGRELSEAEEAVASGDVVQGVEAVRSLRPRS